MRIKRHSIKLYVSRFFCLLFAALVSSQILLSPTYAEDYNGTPSGPDPANGIIFYDGNQAGTCAPGGSGSTGSACCSTQLTGNGNEDKVYNYFIGKGLTPAQAAGIMGNMQTESGFEPERLQGVYDKQVPAAQAYPTQGDVAHTGWGLVQWTPYTKIINPTQAAGRDPNDLGTQLDFLWGQLYGKAGDLGMTSPELGAGTDLKQQSTPETASDSFGTNYERFSTDSGGTRAGYARAIYVKYTTGTPLPPNATPPPAAASGCGGPGDISAYKNPLRDVKSLQPNRVDQGVDYIGTGPVYPLGNAKVTRITSPWCGSSCTQMSPDNFIEYQLSDGPATGKYVYVAEACDTKVKVGDAVTSSTVLCNMNPDSIETGWANSPNDSYALAHDEYKSASTCSGNGYVTAYGQNFDALMKKLGAPAGTHDPGCGISTAALAPGWPQW